MPFIVFYFLALQGGGDCWQCGQRCDPPAVGLARGDAHTIEGDGQRDSLPRPLVGTDATGHLGHNGQTQLEEHALEGRSVFFSHQAIDDGVEAAAAICQAVGQWEEVRLSYVVRATHVYNVQMDHDAPKREDVVGEPTGAERKHHRRHRLGNVGLPPGVAAPQLVLAEEAQQKQVGEGDDGVGQQKGHQHSQELVYAQPRCARWETDQTGRVVAHVVQVGKHGAGHGCYEGRGPDEGRDQRRGAGPAAHGCGGVECSGHVAVAGQAHGREEEAAGKDVERRQQGHRLARGQAEGPAVVQCIFHGPERQGQGEEQLGQRQVEHKEVDGSCGDGVGGVEQEHHQQVPQHPGCGHDEVHHRDNDPQPQGLVGDAPQPTVHTRVVGGIMEWACAQDVARELKTGEVSV